MRIGWKQSSVVAAGLGVVLILPACGSRVTGPHAWHLAVTETTGTEPAGTQVRQVDAVRGPLVDGAGHAVPGTLFQERCNRLFTPGQPTDGIGWNCFVFLNTGPKFYAAGGPGGDRTGDPFSNGFGVFGDPPASGGSLTVTLMRPSSGSATALLTVDVIAQAAIPYGTTP